MGKDKVPAKLPVNVRDELRETLRRIRLLGTEDFLVPALSDPSRYLLSSPGKLVRPALVLCSAHAIGKQAGKYVDLAISVELMHTSSLIHDDIIDGDRIRRGKQTVSSKYGIQSAIVAGDALIAKAVMLASAYGGNVMSAISRSAMEMCAGESLDSYFQRERKTPDIETYMKIARLKSASLISASCSAPAIHSSDGRVKIMAGFGMDLGIAFQIRDDVMDFMQRDKRNGGGSEKFRPNIVATLHSSGLSTRKAIEEAIAINNRYVIRARKRLGRGRLADIFDTYTDQIMLGPK
ncbi:MAG: polyprenyl synthetase family protein [Candidatus Micrarchaeota archaeon]|nr:polyprenyl synthetase family protein [Candidatus Micrarchaeota archaeon]MDE1848373.1 polyprenyl synthetase family protein [Candidatus Micrarchaeota archaeon]MDE1864810.1 polyprenyl synthetase family protein [Candidatus Micrarchaeota archaeon]